MQPQVWSLLLVGLLCTVPACFAQSPSPANLIDTPVPAAYNGPQGNSVPTVDAMQFQFTPRYRADAEQPLFAYPEGFPAVSCTNGGEIYNVSFNQLYTPEGVQNYAVHLSSITPYPNNITGDSTGTDQSIFTVNSDIWLNFQTGVVSAANNPSSAGVYSFDQSYDGQRAQENTHHADATVINTVQSISSDAFYGASGGGSGLSYSQYPAPAAGSVGPGVFSGTQEMATTNWVRSVESLQLYGGLVTLQATRAEPCTALTAGAFQLAPLLDYITEILNQVADDDGSEHFDQYFGQLNATYVQSNANVDTEVYATLRTANAYIPYDVEILDPSLGLTESQCIVHAKNYTIQTANVQGTRPANVWNFCATGVCNYVYPNGTSGTSVSPYAGSHTASTCTLGYSSAVDSNEYVEPAYITSGQGSAGRFNPVRATVLPTTTGIIQTSSSSFAGTPVTFSSS